MALQSLAYKGLAPAILAGMVVFSSMSSYAATGGEGGSRFFGGIFSSKQSQPSVEQGHVQLAQAVDPRVNDLEEHVRQLTGRVEELNFMVLQMQEQIRQLQGGDQNVTSVAPTARTDMPVNNQTANNTASSTPTMTDDMNGRSSNPRSTPQTKRSGGFLPGVFSSGRTAQDGNDKTPVATTDGSATPPQELGTIQFDKDGNIIGQSSDAAPTDATQQNPTEISDPKQLYDIGYKRILAGDYSDAETIFRTFQERFPNDPMIADASFWLGESLYGQGKYSDAAAVYTDVQHNYRDSPRGPENLLKLGMTMAKLENTKVACAVFAEIGKRYKNTDPMLVKRVKDEQNRNHCQ